MLNGKDYQPENDREDQQEDNIGDQQKQTQRPSTDDEDQVTAIPVVWSVRFRGDGEGQ
ncbi:hypothetical protein L914_06771 [Phytophthora nicotianae]|uniref:Uncharacterized protein n=1 Tax=Phytophthora nicotianae TaxID=4792 RepID=W2NJI5_PHYNI|nr:hypothetical protein L914_06771 [Phytophthora nicotianae]